MKATLTVSNLGDELALNLEAAVSAAAKIAVTAMEFRASAEDISRMSHSHPTYAEAIKEAALAATEDRALHM